MSIDFVFKFLKFGIVGFIGMLFDFGATWIFKEKIKLNRYVANSIGFIIAATLNYILNKLWTFHNHDTHVTTQYLIFMSISTIGLGINNIFLYIFEKKFSIKFYVAKLLAIGITTLWNFFANYLITFS